MNNTDSNVLSKGCTSSGELSLIVLKVLTNIVGGKGWKNCQQLLKLIKSCGKNLVQTHRGETPVLNTVLRVLKIIREEAVRILKGIPEFEENLTNVLFAEGTVDYEKVEAQNVREPIENALDELDTETKIALDNMATQSQRHIHSNEIIFTIGYSDDVFHFLRYAAKNGRAFQVMVAECSPENHGHKMAQDLDREKISVVVVPDSHAFAVMSRVNKVIVSCHTVFTDGGMRAVVGTHGVLLAAKNFSVPTYVCLPQYKISPKFFKPNPLEWLGNPDHVLAPNIHEDNNSSDQLTCEVLNPEWDYIPQGLVSLFITSVGGNAPSYVYAMVREFFHKDDIQDAASWEE